MSSGDGRLRIAAALAIAAAAMLACDAVTDIALAGADFGGATADAHCDRRFVGDGGTPSAFCQEVIDTVAASEFSDDCRDKFQASPGPGKCPRDHVIAGCELVEDNQDKSTVFDWYYDVSGFPLLPDGGLAFASPVPEDAAAVARTCADRDRYEAGASLVLP